jgi:hypothetical protein
MMLKGPRLETQGPQTGTSFKEGHVSVSSHGGGQLFCQDVAQLYFNNKINTHWLSMTSTLKMDEMRAVRTAALFDNSSRYGPMGILLNSIASAEKSIATRTVAGTHYD